MAKRTVADQFVEILLSADVRRMYGVVGDSLNPVVDSVRRHDGIDWVLVRKRGGGRFRSRRRGTADGPADLLRGQLRPRPRAPGQRAL
jgi:pyruvate dehydrogenase (quinone)